MINLKNIVISGKEVCPIIEGGKEINGTDGRSSGHFAKEGCVGTISLVSADYYDENGNVVDFDGNVIGKMQPDGSIVDAAGNVIGQADAADAAPKMAYGAD